MRLIGRFLVWSFALIGMTVTLGGVAAIAAAIYFSSQTPEIPGKAILWLDLDNGIRDRRADQDPFSLFSEEPPNTLRDAVAALQAGARDSRIVGLAVRLGGAPVDVAMAQELRQAVAAFRASGKFALAFADSFGAAGDATPEYYLAAAFEEIWMQPSGTLSLTGIAIEIPFLRDALNKAGIQPQFEQRHEYKSAVETFTRAGITRPTRESLERVLGSWMRQIMGDISIDRGLPATQLRALIDRSPLLAEEARNSGLIDRLGYWDQFSDALYERAGRKTEPLGAMRYAASAPPAVPAAANVALIYGTGPIENRGDSEGPFDRNRFAAAAVAEAIDDAAEDRSIQAIVLRINSPGGSYIASDIVRRSVLQARAGGKPVIASMGQYAASGGYFAAMGADRIVAQPGSLTGSIGVFGGKFATEALWEKLGVHWGRVAIGANAGMWSAIQPFSDSAAERHKSVIDFIYRDFTAKMAADRKIAADRIDAVARGRVWTGADAREIGLVDQLGGLATAMDETRLLLDLPADALLNVVLLPKAKTPIQQIRDAFASGVPFPGILAGLIGSRRSDPFAELAQRLEPVTGDLSIFAPASGILQIPPFRIAR